MAYALSPGVTWSEIDLTTIVPSVSTTEGAFVGDFAWGPINEVTSIGNELELVRWFHKPDANNFTSWFTAANFLSYAESLKLVRAANTTSALNATSGNTGLLIQNQNHYELDYLDLSAEPMYGMFAARYAGELGNSLKVSVFAGSNKTADFANWEYKDEFSTVPSTSSFVSSRGGANDEMHIIVVDTLGKFSGTANTILEKFAYVSKASDAKTDDGSSNYWVNVLNGRSEFIYAINPPNQVLAELQIASIVNGGSGYSNGNIVVDGGHGSGIVVTANVSNTQTGVITSLSILSAGQNYYTDDAITANLSTLGGTSGVVSLALRSTGVIVNGVEGQNWTTSTSDSAFTQSNVSYTTTLSHGTVGKSKATDGQLELAYDLFKDSETWDVSLIMTGDHSQTVSEYVVENIAGGTSGSPDTGRRDCVVFISPDMENVVDNAGQEATDIVAKRNNYNSSSFAVMDSNWKKQFDKYNNTYRWVPLNGDIAGLCARTDFERDPWWSPAGFNRGHIKNVTRLAWNPGKADRDTLYKNGVNPVLQFKGEGVVLYGDKTMLSKPSAFDRINVRRLFIVLEKAISKAAKYSLFEFNDEFTRAQFVALVEPYLRDIKGRRGIYDFRVVCDTTNNTPEVIDRNEFVGDIYIKPARSINFIHLNFVAVRTGVAFSEVIGKF
jgi:hypothetical protein